MNKVVLIIVAIIVIIVVVFVLYEVLKPSSESFDWKSNSKITKKFNGPLSTHLYHNPCGICSLTTYAPGCDWCRSLPFNK